MNTAIIKLSKKKYILDILIGILIMLIMFHFFSRDAYELEDIGALILIGMICFSIFFISLIDQSFKIDVRETDIYIHYLFRRKEIVKSNIKDYSVAYKHKSITLFFMDGSKPISLRLIHYTKKDRYDLAEMLLQIIMANTKNFDGIEMEALYGKHADKD